MAVVAVSALTGQRVDGEAACTGEISVQGRVKAVGGVPAKLEAARQAGIRKVFIPRDNDMEGMHDLGMEVRCETRLIEIDRKRLVFEVEAFDACGLIGEGTHERFIIDNQKFMQKANGKLN